MPPISDRLLSCTKWFVLLTALTLGACASQPQAPANAATADYSYKIGPGDTLNIVVWRNPELSMSVPVRPDGKISAPLIDDLAAMGKDSTTLARDIEKELAKFIRDPVVHRGRRGGAAQPRAGQHPARLRALHPRPSGHHVRGAAMDHPPIRGLLNR